MFPRATPKSRRRTRRRRRRAAPSPSLPLANPKRRQELEPTIDRSAEFARPTGIDVDASELPTLADMLFNPQTLPKLKESLDFDSFADALQATKEALQEPDRIGKAIARFLTPFTSQGIERARRAEQGFDDPGFALDRRGNLLIKPGKRFRSVNRTVRSMESPQTGIDAIQNFIFSPFRRVQTGIQTPSQLDADNLIQEALVEALGRGADFGEGFVPAPKTGETFDKLKDLIRREIRRVGIRSRDGKLLREDEMRLRRLGIRPEQVEPFLRQFRKKDPAGRLRGPSDGQRLHR